MALAANKPYQLISPPTDRQQVPSQMAPWFRWRPALLVREVHRQAVWEETHIVSARDTPLLHPARRRSPGKSRTAGSQARAPGGLQPSSQTQGARDAAAAAPAPACVPQGQAATCSQAPGNALPTSYRKVHGHPGLTDTQGTRPSPELLPPESTRGVALYCSSHTIHDSQGPTGQHTEYPGPQEEADRPAASALQTSLPVCSQMATDTRGLSAPEGLPQAVQPPPASKKAPTQCAATWQLGHTWASTSPVFLGKVLCLWAKGPQGHFHSPWAAGMGLQPPC